MGKDEMLGMLCTAVHMFMCMSIQQAPRAGRMRHSLAPGGGTVAKWRCTLSLRGGAQDRLDSDLSLDHSTTASQEPPSKYAGSESMSQQGGSEWPPAEADDTDDLRAQVVRLMTQAMHSFGFPESARSLELESGIALHDGPAREALALQQALIDGDWETADEILSTANWVHDHMRYPAYRCRYLELVQAGKLREAEQCLSANVQPAAQTRGQLAEAQKLKTLLSAKTTSDAVKLFGSISHSRVAVRGPCQPVVL